MNTTNIALAVGAVVLTAGLAIAFSSWGDKRQDKKLDRYIAKRRLSLARRYATR